MSAIILDGTKIAAQIKEEVGEEVKDQPLPAFVPAWLWYWPGTIRLRRSTFAIR